VSEFHRVLRAGGEVYAFVPFIQGFHASPHDFQRYTRSGLLYLFKDFEVTRIENCGPTSGMIWIVSEWISIVLSFGIGRLQQAVALVFGALLSPLKWLDSILRHFPGSDNIATGFLVVARKK
jgi:hypothetical protein